MTPDQSPKPTLLIVDDEPDVLDSLRHLFHRRYRVLTAESGREALALLDSQGVSVLLSDQRMPGMSGDELLAHARETHPDVIRLLFTGFADIQTVINAVNQGGIFRYILKPWDAVELESVVRQAADQYALLTERRRLLAELRAANARLVEANQELAEANALKTTFLEVASHELNTPITIIQGLSDLLRLLQGDRDEQEQELIDQLSHSAHHLARLVASMLKLMRANDYRHALRTSSTDLGALLHEVADLLHPFVRARRLQMDVDVAADLGCFQIDADKVRDVVTNLLSNAIKFTPDGGSLRLSAWSIENGQAAEIVVEDRGIGLDVRALEHLFEPFFTELDPAYHSSGDLGFGKRGLGLGLSLVKSFVELHGGQVRAESAPEEGTRITVRLPRSPFPVSPVVVECP